MSQEEGLEAGAPVLLRTISSRKAMHLALNGRPVSLSIAMAAVIAACLVLRIIVGYLRPELLAADWFYYTGLRLDSIAFGVLLAGICEIPAAHAFVDWMQKPETVLGAGAVLRYVTVLAPGPREPVAMTRRLLH